ncbi:E3 ubiquitin protein ligase UPL3 [Tanacetum coccineum]
MYKELMYGEDQDVARVASLVCRKQYLESIHDRNEILNLRFRGTPVEDLCLDFTLPGYLDYVLNNGDDNVDLNNLDECISMVVDATVKTGITRQMEAFRAGFNQVFDISDLQIFTPSELDLIYFGGGESDTLVEHIKFDHGSTSKSPAVVNLLEIMGEFIRSATAHSVRSVYIKSKEAPAKDILKDLVEMCRGIFLKSARISYLILVLSMKGANVGRDDKTEHMRQRELEANAREEAREREWQLKMDDINSMLRKFKDPRPPQ